MEISIAANLHAKIRHSDCWYLICDYGADEIIWERKCRTVVSTEPIKLKAKAAKSKSGKSGKKQKRQKH